MHRSSRAMREYAQQVNWIRQHGGSVQGYIDYYGSAAERFHYGDGGAAIYARDQVELRRRLSVIEGGIHPDSPLALTHKFIV